MEIYDLIKDTAAAIAEDSDIGNWCRAVFGAGPEVLIDEDLRDPSGAAPAVRLHSPYKQAHQERRRVEHGFYVYVLVNSAPDTIEPRLNLAEFAATEYLMTFIGKIITAIYTAKPAEAVMEYDLATDTISAFPYFEADIGLVFSQHLTIGQDPITI